MVAEHAWSAILLNVRCSLAKISMVAELGGRGIGKTYGCSLAKISMVAERIDFS